ncbi:MAG: hypothetical protein R2909_05620 [Gemmatimonadales bacterium]
MLAAFAHALVRWRLVVIAIWLVIGVISFTQAPKTPELLALRGGSETESEARRADRLLTERFGRPFGEFFAVILEGPTSFRAGPARAVLDSLTRTAARQPHVQTVVSWLTREDSLFLGSDERTTFFLASLAIDGESAGNRWPESARRWRTPSPRCPTGRLSASSHGPRSARSRRPRRPAPRTPPLELRVRDLALVILILAFGALVATVVPPW